MHYDAAYLKRVLLLLTGFLLVSCASTNVRPISAGDLVTMKGRYSVKTPNGNNWRVETDEVRGELRFDRNLDGGKSTFIVIHPVQAEPSSISQTEDQAAISIFAREERIMRERGSTRSYFLKDLSRGTTTIGRKRLHVMKYTISDHNRVPMEIKYAMYLYFPNYTKQTRTHYIFLVGDVFKINNIPYATDLTVVDTVIDSFETK